MLVTRSRSFAVFTHVRWLAVLALAPFARAQIAVPVPPLISEKAYTALTDTRRSVTNFNVEVVRGFAVRDDGSELFAINAYESTIVRHVGASGVPTHHWRTLTNPVSIAFHGKTGLLVVGQGNHAIARHDEATGVITDYLQLRSEPSDLVVDEENDECWVSCMGDDSVCQIGLSPTLTLIKVWNRNDGLIVKRPRFLYLERNDAADPADNWVYVAPLVSGNNTLTTSAFGAPPILFDGNNAALFNFDATINGRGLPDVDLYRIRPLVPAVDRVVRQSGSLLLAHGRNPVTNDYWMLNVDHDNTNPAKPNEPALRGTFAENRLSLTPQASYLPPVQPLATPPTQIDLDNTTPGSATPVYVPARSVSFPYALDFDPLTGWAFVASSTTPNIVLVDPSGARTLDMSLTNPSTGISGSVVRTVKYLPPFLLAYCQQTSNVLVWTITPFSTTPFASLWLGNDPTPAPVKHGRKTWYDATTSLDGRTTCNTCHPQGGADGLAWAIAAPPVDQKPTMVTQTLMGIEDSFPYHWRGERDLEGFNAAFTGLLGRGAQLPANDFKQFKEFVYSLAPQANPAQDFSRRLKDSLQPLPQENGLVGDVTDGDFWYHNLNTDGVMGVGACVTCHANPTGSNGMFLPENLTRDERANFMEVTQLDNQLVLKDQALVAVQGVLGPFVSQWLGTGTLHDGTIHSLFAFVNAFPMTNQQKADVTAFIRLFDQGTAPSIHFGARLAQGFAPSVPANITSFLLNQVPNGWVGCVAFGTFPIGGVPTPMHWFYDPASATFQPADPSLSAPQRFSAFVANATAGLADNVFLGVPPGNERRLGIDWDHDGLDLRGELTASSDPWRPDTDGDAWPDGYEVANGSVPTSNASTPFDTTPPALTSAITVDFVNPTLVKLNFSTNEPARWSITCSTPGGAPITDSRETFDTLHTAVVQKLDPSTSGIKTNTFSGSLVLTDLSGNPSASIPLPSFTSGTLIHNGTLSNTVTGSLAFATQARGRTSYAAQVNLRIDWREQGPPAIASPNQVVVAQLLKEVPNPLAPNDPDWAVVPAADIVTNAPATSFLLNGVTYGTGFGDPAGPFLVLVPTGTSGPALGRTSVNFTVSNLTSGQKVMFNILSVLPVPPGYNPAAPAFPGPIPASYEMNATPDALRRIVSTL